MQNKKQKVGIVGYGQFGQFLHKHLAEYFEIVVFKKEGSEGGEEFIKTNLENLDYLILSVPFESLENVCKIYSKYVNKNTVVVDVTSVKVKPIELMQKYFTQNQILGTHPIFGPQSGKNGIEGLTIVLSNVNLDTQKYAEIKNFLASILKLKVVEKTAGEHDKEMAYVQGLTHFIGRAVTQMRLQDCDTATKSYKQILNLIELIGADSWELYKTIQNANPYTDSVRAEFLENLNGLQDKLAE